MPKTLLTCSLVLWFALVLVPSAGAMKVVKLLNHQGQLLDTAGQPVTGSHVLTFRIYTDPTGGTLLHEESQTIVFGSDGLFNVQIGSTVPLDIEDLVDPFETTPEALRYLEVEVDSDGPMPRVQLDSSPYSLGAYRVAGDFFSSHNEILMIDSTGDTTTTLASKKLFVGGLSWGVEVDSSGRTEMLMQDTGPSGERGRIATHTPEWTNLNGGDAGLTLQRVDGTDSAEATVTHNTLVISNTPASGDEHSFKAEGTPIRAKVQVQSDPGVGILKGGFMEADVDGSRIGLSTESTTDEGGEYWFLDVKPGVAEGVTQTMTMRTSSTDSSFGQIKIDTSEAGLRMNKADLIAEIASKTGHAQMGITDLSAADKGAVLMQHNQSDLEFLMRLHNSADTALVRMRALVTGPELRLSTEAGGTTQNAADITQDKFQLTRALLSAQQSVFSVDAAGTATGAALRIRYPLVTGGASEVFLGDLDGDALPDLSVAGNVGIGSTAPTEKLHVAGNICVTGGYLTCSDARYKTEIEPISNPMDQLRRLQGVEFDWRQTGFRDRDFPEDRQMGFVAQEVQKVLPGVVKEGSDGYLAMDYARLTPLLVEALKEQQERIDKLEALLLQLTDDQVAR